MSRPDKLSSADVASICQAAGLQAVRKNRYVILPVDFEEAYKGVVRKGDDVMEFCRSPLLCHGRSLALSETLFADRSCPASASDPLQTARRWLHRSGGSCSYMRFDARAESRSHDAVA